MTRVHGIALFVLAAGCSPAAPESPPAEPPSAAGPRAAATATDAAISRADAILADAARREAEYQQAVAESKQQKLPVPVVTEFTPEMTPVTGYAASGGAPRGEESWWRGQMRKLQEQQAQNLADADDALKRVNGATRRTGPGKNYVQAQEDYRKAQADYQRAQAAIKREAAAIENLRSEAKRMDIPMEWLQWP